MSYKRRGSNQYRKKANTHYVIWYFLFIGIIVTLSLFAKNQQDTVYAQEILSPLPTNTASSSAEVVPTASPRLEDPSLERLTLQKEIEDYIRTIFGKDAKVAIAVSRNECGPTNKKYPSCQFHTAHENSIGLFQINIESQTTKVHWARIPGDTLEEKIEWLKEPQNNVLMAYWIFTKSGWNPWSAYTNGNYLKDM
jgi:hypothetical protein